MIELTIGLLAISLLISSTRLLYFLQLKEYRIDRFIDFIRFDKGKRQLVHPFAISVYLAFIVFLIVDPNEQNALILVSAALAFNIYYVLRHSFYRFKPTKKALTIFASEVLLLAAYLYLQFSIEAVYISYIAAPLLLILIVLAFIPVTKVAKEIYILQAKRKISSMKNLTVIGITGSYGKSSTKEFLYQILSTKYKVLKTPANINTDIGVANIILNKLKTKHEIFIVEMGAYRIGEIANICKMRKPDIGILTAVAKQHLSLFGSLENIKIAKSELLQSVKDVGLRIINGDNENSADVAKTLGLESVTYGTKSKDVDYKINDLKETDEKILFNVDGVKVEASVVGLHQALNITAAIIAAKDAGMTNIEIECAVKQISPPEAVLSLMPGYRGSIILNDSYNSNPDGFIAAINVAKNQKVQGRKILITMGMVELGKESDELHSEVAKHAKDAFDLFIITRKEAYRPFAEVVPENKIKLIEDPDVLFKYIKKNVEKYDLILIENRLYKNVLDLLLKD